ncbi:hypothetical protein ACFOY4_33555 [Actinomadura syzygii]|uniref:Uncharacterized protein n=1 Tax=Actinomadura syzygii TaxID=1427538 RepID=A0A5D0UBP6_9ACTN|nr:hypothetical protein [Actinomadura syzygii]TYC15013.1 hypothetical protein FXF65_12855 [Actinomadura syzygii]
MKTTSDAEQAGARLGALRDRLDVCGYDLDLDETGLTVVAPVSDGPRMADKVTCRPRDSDGGALWFWTSWGEPIAQADRIIDAQVVIGGYLKPSL